MVNRLFTRLVCMLYQVITRLYHLMHRCTVLQPLYAMLARSCTIVKHVFAVSTIVYHYDACMFHVCTCMHHVDTFTHHCFTIIYTVTSFMYPFYYSIHTVDALIRHSFTCIHIVATFIMPLWCVYVILQRVYIHFRSVYIPC